jgi:mannose-6-phosphate isomerase-like protein (cupin superfamily)
MVADAGEGVPLVRRVVAGQGSDGTSVIVSDGQPPRVAAMAAMPGFASTAVWATDVGLTAVPGSDDPTPAMTSFVPGVGGTRFTVVVLPPEHEGPAPALDPAELAAEFARALPGLGDTMDPGHPGFHVTDTVDYNTVVAGEVWLVVDEGEQVLLRPGDIAVLTGNRHAWRNTSGQPVVLHSVLVGAPRQS